MSLIKCPECNKDISNRAEVCPSCGWIKTNKRIIESLFFKAGVPIIIAAIGFLSALYGYIYQENIEREKGKATVDLEYEKFSMTLLLKVMETDENQREKYLDYLEMMNPSDRVKQLLTRLKNEKDKIPVMIRKEVKRELGGYTVIVFNDPMNKSTQIARQIKDELIKSQINEDKIGFNNWPFFGEKKFKEFFNGGYICKSDYEIVFDNNEYQQAEAISKLLKSIDSNSTIAKTPAVNSSPSYISIRILKYPPKDTPTGNCPIF